MRQLYFSVLAREDLRQIARYIARDNPARARTFVNELRERCTRLISQPNQGISREECAPGLRMISHGRYLIFYGAFEDDIHIDRVLHGARDVRRNFQQDQ